LRIYLPKTLLEHLRTRIHPRGDSSQAMPAADEWRQQIVAKISNTPIELSAVLTTLHIDFREALTIAPGSIIKLPLRDPKEVELETGGRSLLRCKLGQLAGYLAIQIGLPTTD